MSLHFLNSLQIEFKILSKLDFFQAEAKLIG